MNNNQNETKHRLFVLLKSHVSMSNRKHQVEWLEKLVLLLIMFKFIKTKFLGSLFKSKFILNHPVENNSSILGAGGVVLMSDIQMCWFVQLVAAGCCKTRLTTFSIYSSSHDIWILINLLYWMQQFQFFTFRIWIIVFLDTVIISTADSFACSVNCRLTAASSSPPSLQRAGFVQWGSV